MKKACSKGARGQRRSARGETPASLTAAPPKHGTPFVSSNAAGRSAACAEAEPALGARASLDSRARRPHLHHGCRRARAARVPRARSTPPRQAANMLRHASSYAWRARRRAPKDR
ncbi:hypothetical protein [Burkholderia pseudomallei]|uniref:hypothetical protein n=1 Tax=Burkholderia pseudomallei TaxID=28450 RepID=UPI000F04FF67|nr:hypothetical protein [Burkholderia pseudomallei]